MADRIGNERRATQGAGKSVTGFYTFTPVKQSEHDAAIEKLARLIKLGNEQLWSTEKWKGKINNGTVELTLSQFRDYFRTLLNNGARAGILHSVILKPDFETGEERSKNLVFRFADRFAEEGENPKILMMKSEFLSPKDGQQKFFEIYDLLDTRSVALCIKKDSPPVGYFTHWEKDKPINQPMGGKKYDDVESMQPKKLEQTVQQDHVSWAALFNKTYLKAKAKNAFNQANNPIKLHKNQRQPLAKLWHNENDMPEIAKAKILKFSEFSRTFKDNLGLFVNIMGQGKAIKIKDDETGNFLFGVTSPDFG